MASKSPDNKIVKVEINEQQFPLKPAMTVQFEDGQVVTASAAMWHAIAGKAKEALDDWSRRTGVAWWN